MQYEELAGLATRLKNSRPNLESLSIASIYKALREHEEVIMSLGKFKSFIYHLTGWDISSQVIRRQLEINDIEF